LQRPGTTNSSTLARVGLDRQLGARSSISWNAGSEFASGADVFRADQAFAGVKVGNDNAAALADPFKSDYSGLSWRLAGLRTHFVLAASWRNERHETQPLSDRKVMALNASIDRQVTPRLVLVVGGGYQRDDIYNIDSKLNAWSANAGLNWQLTQAVTMALQLQHYRGSGVLTFGDYDENRALLRFSYNRIH
jgi:uncharacterized protein (PEP-CTERM system associated)